MPWLRREEYAALIKQGERRDVGSIRDDVERVRTELERVAKALLALRTYMQRRMDAMEEDDNDDEPRRDGAASDSGPGGLAYVPVPWAPKKTVTSGGDEPWAG